MAQIRSSSAEQHSGIVSCSRAVVEMDQGTQQNAALVEQVAAAAQSLQDQSARLEQAVSIFKIGQPTPQAARPWERPAAQRGARPALAYSA